MMNLTLAGTALQKSHEGLLQSILYQILSSSKNWDLLPVLCDKRLARDKDLGWRWTREELVSAIQLVQK